MKSIHLLWRLNRGTQVSIDSRTGRDYWRCRKEGTKRGRKPRRISVFEQECVTLVSLCWFHPFSMDNLPFHGMPFPNADKSFPSLFFYFFDLCLLISIASSRWPSWRLCFETDIWQEGESASGDWQSGGISSSTHDSPTFWIETRNASTF
jgi:hypothetical protein